jgi:hypothetical protein
VQLREDFADPGVATTGTATSASPAAPTSASWLNMVERSFRDITDKHIRRDSFTNVAELELAIALYIAHHNTDPKPFICTASA